MHPEHASKNIPLSPAPFHHFILIKQVSSTRHLSSLWSVPIQLAGKESVRLHFEEVVRVWLRQHSIDSSYTKRHRSTYQKRKKVTENIKKQSVCQTLHYNYIPLLVHMGLQIKAEQIPFWKCSINSYLSSWHWLQYISNLSPLHWDGCRRTEIWKKTTQLKCVSSSKLPLIYLLSFPMHYGLNMDLFFLKHNWDHSLPPGVQRSHNASKEHFVYMFNTKTSIKLSIH